MTQLNQSTWNNFVKLVTVDLSAWGDDVYGFVDSRTYSGDTPLDHLTWQGQVYIPVPFATSGSQRGGENLAKPRIDLPDFGAAMFVRLSGYGLATGAPVKVYQALGDDILADDPHAPFMEEHYLINNVGYEDWNLVIELATHLDYQRAKFPRHVMLRDEYPGLSIDLAR